MKAYILKPKNTFLKKLLGKTEFYFNLVGKNGEIVATSEMYTRKESAISTLTAYFPLFKIEDKTLKNVPKHDS